MIEEAVVSRVLGSRPADRWRVRRGVRRGQALLVGPPRRRQDRGARLGPRPRRRHPGRRGRDHRLRPHRRPVRAGPARRGRGGGRRGPRRWRRRAHRGAHPSSRVTSQPVLHPPRRGGQGHQGRAAPAGRRGGPLPGRRHQAGVGLLRRQPPPDPGGQLRRPARRRRPDPHPVRGRRGAPAATPACRPGAAPSATPWASSCSTATRSRTWPDEAAEQALTKLQARPAPSGRAAGRHRQGRRRRAVPRGVRPRPRGRPHPEEGVGVRRPGRPAGGVAARDHRRRRHHGQRVGHLRHRRRGHARPAQRPHRGRRPHRLHVGPAPGPQGGPRRSRATAAARATSTCRWSA